MTRGILVAGNESVLGRAIEVEAAKRVHKYVSAFITNRIAQPSAPLKEHLPERVEESRISLDWNPGSPISARTLVLAAENRLEHIDEAILVCSPPAVRRPASQLLLADVEILVNDHVKGWFFLVKEIATVFANRKSGTLALVYYDATAVQESKDDMTDLLGASAAASFTAFTRSLLMAARGDPYVTMGFSAATPGDEAGFASFLFKHLDEGNMSKNGKLLTYGKLGIKSWWNNR
ncbi:MAG: hypothetical protein FWG66_05485 [Spirochaetes bacterium]|nr:hypothetical protein [Spirochaetota bacterium]